MEDIGESKARKLVLTFAVFGVLSVAAVLVALAIIVILPPSKAGVLNQFTRECGFAELPASGDGLQVFHFGYGRTGRVWIRAEAESIAIHEFLATSPGVDLEAGVPFPGPVEDARRQAWMREFWSGEECMLPADAPSWLPKTGMHVCPEWRPHSDWWRPEHEVAEGRYWNVQGCLAITDDARGVLYLLGNY